MLQIAVMNESKAISDANVQKMLPAFAQQWNDDQRPVWSTDQANFIFVGPGMQPPPGSWWMVFLDNTDQAQDLAYHDLTDGGLPMSKVFVQTIIDDKASISVAATHELCEMAVDPWLNTSYQDNSGVFWAGEICDPVEADEYGYEIGGILVTDFVTPDWFGHQKTRTQVDLKNHAMTPFEVLTGGYAQWYDVGQRVWQQVTGPLAQKSAMAATAVSGSRRERRARLSCFRPIRSLKRDRNR